MFDLILAADQYYTEIGACDREIIDLMVGQSSEAELELARLVKFRQRKLSQAHRVLKAVERQGGWAVMMDQLEPEMRGEAEEKMKALSRTATEALNSGLEVCQAIETVMGRVDDQIKAMGRGQKLLNAYKGYRASVASCLRRET